MALVTIIAIIFVGIVMWGLSAESARRREPPTDATPEQLVAVQELRRTGYDVEWLEDGTAHMHSPTRKSLHVGATGAVQYRNPKHRGRRR